MRIALYQPDIPQNTGTILRTAACLGLGVDVIGPAGFDLSDRALRRAGMDYLARAALEVHESWAAFRAARGPAGRIVLLTTRGAVRHDAFAFAPSDTLLFGRESAGVPEAVHEAADARVRIAMVAGVRSLNVAISCALVAGEALRQTGLWPGR
ncbi:tRNA (cytidine(34)-2'-O)-methyltransferase [Pseudoxanthobacter sp.]|uniref:tRNA (cytidine(34)-2'-O)-methyltransferase n=1 Tax=Pseudoxanthobacter sp. TaxID=1925742 RepID=UPI002FDFE4CF